MSDEEEKKEEEDGEEEDEELGGLFRVLKRKSEAGKEQKYNANLRDSSKFPVDAPHDWQIEEVSLVFHCYVFVSFCCFLIGSSTQQSLLLVMVPRDKQVMMKAY